jgi:hypothetical protein
MANTTKVLDMIANESLAIAHEKATFIKTTNLQYDETFKWDGNAHKGGQTLRIREPNQYTRRQGSRVMDVQDQNESTQTITVATQDGVDMRFNSAELTLDTNNPKDVERFSKRYIEPAMAVLVSGIDGDYLQSVSKDVYNVVGTAGTVVGASGDISALGTARARINHGLAPKEDRALMLDSITMGTIANGAKAIFHPEGQVKKAFVEGYYARAMGADFYENDRTYRHSVGSDVTVSTSASAAVTDGGVAITMNSTDGNINKGDVFTVAGVYACHPETKQSLGYLQQFVATAASVGVVAISPATVLTGAKQNVCSIAGAQLATTAFNSQVMTFVGTAALSYQHNLMYHKDAFAFVTADLPLMDDAHKCVRKNMDGLSVRVWMGSDIRNDELLVRLDILYGWKTLRPAWASRITN